MVYSKLAVLLTKCKA